MSGYVKLMVFGEEIGRVLTDGRATTEELLELVGAIWSEEGNCWTTCDWNTEDTDYWYNAEDVEIVDIAKEEMEIEILMQDKCTKAEASKYVANGTVIVPVEEWADFIAQYDDQYEDIDAYHKEYSIENIKAGKLADHSCVEFKGKSYIIEYVL